MIQVAHHHAAQSRIAVEHIVDREVRKLELRRLQAAPRPVVVKAAKKHG